MASIKTYKRLSIKFGIVCGMVVTLCGAVNSVLGSIQKWNETFEKETEAAQVYEPHPSPVFLEQAATVPENVEDPEELFDLEPAAGAPMPDPSAPMGSSSSAPTRENLISLTGWLLVTVVGTGLMWILSRMHKKDTERMEEEKNQRG